MDCSVVSMETRTPMYHYLIGLIPLIALSPKEPYFEPEVIDDRLSASYSMAIGDVDGDGKPDILLADQHALVWYRNGDWQKFVLIEHPVSYTYMHIAARDIDGDGRVEVAVSGHWDPEKNPDTNQPGSIHYLVRPEDPTEKWTPVEVSRTSEVLRLQWVKADKRTYHLVASSSQDNGRRRKGTEVRMVAHAMPENLNDAWPQEVIGHRGYLAGAFDLQVDTNGTGEIIYMGSANGVRAFSHRKDRWRPYPGMRQPVQDQQFGELKLGYAGGNVPILAGIEPHHGNILAAYVPRGEQPEIAYADRIVLDRGLSQGRGLGVADFIEQGRDQVVAGWCMPNDEGLVGIQLYIPFNDLWEAWTIRWIDRDEMACEQLAVADLDGDGLPDIIASGRTTRNLKVYWNRSEDYPLAHNRLDD